jgi:GNAT superfamily N-acetyltransferase
VRVLVAEHDGRLSGVIAFSQEQLHQLWVLPEHWGTRVATTLYEAALAEHAMMADWTLWVLEENHRARRFYERRGWMPDGRRQASRHPPYPVLLGYALRAAK